MNGGDVYGKLFFSRLNVFWDVPLSVADVHRVDKQKVSYKIESRPNTLASWAGGLPTCKIRQPTLVGGCLSIYIITLLRYFSSPFYFKANSAPAQRKMWLQLALIMLAINHFFRYDWGVIFYFLYTLQQQKYWNFIRNETLLETNVLYKFYLAVIFLLISKAQ